MPAGRLKNLASGNSFQFRFQTRTRSYRHFWRHIVSAKSGHSWSAEAPCRHAHMAEQLISTSFRTHRRCCRHFQRSWNLYHPTSMRITPFSYRKTANYRLKRPLLERWLPFGRYNCAICGACRPLWYSRHVSKSLSCRNLGGCNCAPCRAPWVRVVTSSMLERCLLFSRHNCKICAICRALWYLSTHAHFI